MKNTIKLHTISLNGLTEAYHGVAPKLYTRLTSNTIDTDLYDALDYVRMNNRTYYANKSNVRGVSKSIQSLIR